MRFTPTSCIFSWVQEPCDFVCCCTKGSGPVGQALASAISLRSKTTTYERPKGILGSGDTANGLRSDTANAYAEREFGNS